MFVFHCWHIFLTTHITTVFLTNCRFASPGKFVTMGSRPGLSAVLLQKHGEMLFPVSYASKKLAGAPTSYGTVEKECTAIV